ncbi:MAG: hypothetical protein KAR20_04365 [Candidatus Heimdallarchaeota archaeon]|nr:hypothetical protein [Candidatus Heimdallarchaeota archaeon]
MKLLQEINEAAEEQKLTRKGIMKLIRSKVLIDQYGYSYAESRKDHQIIKMHGVRDAEETAEKINKLLKDNGITDVKADYKAAVGQWGSKPGIIIRFPHNAYGKVVNRKNVMPKEEVTEAMLMEIFDPGILAKAKEHLASWAKTAKEKTKDSLVKFVKAAEQNTRILNDVVNAAIDLAKSRRMIGGLI